MPFNFKCFFCRTSLIAHMQGYGFLIQRKIGNFEIERVPSIVLADLFVCLFVCLFVGIVLV